MKKHRLVVARAYDAMDAAERLSQLIRDFEREGYEVEHLTMSQTGSPPLSTTIVALMVRYGDTDGWSKLVERIVDLEGHIEKALKLMDCESENNHDCPGCDWWDGSRCKMLTALRGDASGELQPCGHERRFIVSGDERTNWCALCELEAQKARYGLGSKEAI